MEKIEIKELIKNKKPNIDEQTLEYFTNYFWILSNEKEIIQNLDLNDLIDNAFLYASKIEFYDKDSQTYEKLGPDCKGIREPESKTIFIRNDLDEELKEITVYHELHHAVQTNPQNDNVGINQESNIGRLIMEAQTQYFAEYIYNTIHNVEPIDKEIPSEQLRM